MESEETHCGDILVVDDAATNQLLISSILSDAGHNVRVADNGVSALMLCEESPPDLILLDIRMPGIDGHEVCKLLKESKHTRGISVIFVTVSQEPEDKSRCFKLGAKDYITKPFEPIELRIKVHTHIRIRRLEEKLRQLTG
ncbi:MAG: response regulator [Candidatus Sedimenticola sp. 20ELBAFRAG]